MARVIVTGGSGKLGRAVVADLAGNGWDVTVFDRVVPDRLPDGVQHLPVDLTDYGQVLDAVLGVEERYDRVEAVVHLAAVPAPGLRPDQATFANNMNSSFHVVTAARRAGIRKIVWASSETVLGLPFDTPPPYVPVDEEYTPRPESTYSLVKTLEEELARQLCRWDPQLSMIGLRFSNVMAPEDYAGFAAFQDDPQARRWNLWGYIDARDGAQAVRLALQHPEPGAEVFIIAATDTVMTTSDSELLDAVFPDVPRRDGIGEHTTLLSIDKARRVLGYAPEHSWRDGT